MESLILENPTTKLWTRSEYEAAGELGLLEGQRFELIEGAIVVMSPQKEPHYFSIDAVAEKVKEAFGKGYWVRIQVQLNLGKNSAPEPDIAVVVGSRLDYAQEHPKTAVLVIEIAGTTLRYDQTTKAALYAKFGIADYWIVNLFLRQIEVYRRPIEVTPGVWKYSKIKIYKEGTFLRALEMPKAKIAVADLLPPVM